MEDHTSVGGPGLTSDKSDVFDSSTHRPYVTWSQCESEKLRSLVSAYGSQRRWSDIAEQIPGRTSKQCRDRWVNHMKLSAKPDNWAPNEDFLLAYHHSKVGTKWAKIACALPGRTAASIKNHWNSTCRSTTLASKRSLLCSYTHGLRSGMAPNVAFQQSVVCSKQSYLFTQLKSELDSPLTTSGSCEDAGTPLTAAPRAWQHAGASFAVTAKSDSSSCPSASDEDDVSSTDISPNPPLSTLQPSPALPLLAKPILYKPAPFKLPPLLPSLPLALPGSAFQLFPHFSVAQPAVFIADGPTPMSTSQAFSFDIDALLASNPGLDPALLPELWEEQFSLVQDLDGLSFALPSYAAPSASLPASLTSSLHASLAAAMLAARPSALPTGSAVSPGWTPTLSTLSSAAATMALASTPIIQVPSIRSLYAPLPAVVQYQLPTVRLASVLGSGGLPGSASPGTSYASAVSTMRDLGLGAGEAALQELVMKSFTLGQLVALRSGAEGVGPGVSPASSGALNLSSGQAVSAQGPWHHRR